MMDGMDSIRRTIYDKFGNVMKTFKLDLDSRGRSETIDQSPIDIGSEPIETTNESTDPASDALWDLSELDPEIYEDVFEPSLEAGTPPLLQNTVVASDAINDDIEDIQDVVIESKPLEKPVNFQTVSLDDLDDSEDQNMEDIPDNVEEDPVEEESLVTATSVESVIPEESDMGDLFAEKIEVRPQVRQLLDKYGTVSIEQLRNEIKEVSGLLTRK